MKTALPFVLVCWLWLMLTTASAQPDLQQAGNQQVRWAIMDKEYWRAKALCEQGLGTPADCALAAKKFAPQQAKVRKSPKKDAKLWDQIQRDNEPIGYAFYYHTFPKGRYAKEAYTLWEKATYEQAIRHQDLEKRVNALNDFLRIFPSGTFATGAEQQINDALDQIAWLRIPAVKGQLEPYRQYVANYPQSRFVYAAQDSIRAFFRHESDLFTQIKQNARAASVDYQRLNAHVQEFDRYYEEGSLLDSVDWFYTLAEDRLWAEARSNKEAQGFRDYLGYFPSGKNATQARQLLTIIEQEDAAWKQSQDAYTSAAFAGYLAQYPSGRYAFQAREAQAECGVWDRAVRSGRSQDFSRYLDQYPKGYFAGWAQEEMDFGQVHAGNLGEVRWFLGNYPQGKYTTEVQNWFSNLEQQTWNNVSRSGNPQGFQQYLQDFPDGPRVEEAQYNLYMIEMETNWRLATNMHNPAMYQEFLNNFPNSPHQQEAIFFLNSLIEENDWSLAQQQRSVEGYRNYLNSYPQGRFARNATESLRQIENELWNQANRRNTPEGFGEYLSKFPNGNWASEAFNRKSQLEDDRAWQRVVQENTANAYRDYLNRFPQGKQRSEAQRLLDALNEQQEWDNAVRQNTLAAFEGYVSRFPNGTHVTEAQTRIAQMKEQAAWNTAQAQNQPGAYRTFLSVYPNGTYATQALQALNRLETEAWTRARNVNTLEGYDAFLRDFPNSSFAQQATQAKAVLIEKQAWNAAQAQNQVSGYQQYLNNYPQGTYRAQAQAAILTLDRAAWQTAILGNTYAAFRQYLLDFPNGEQSARARTILLEMENRAWTQVEQSGKVDSLEWFIREFPQSSRLTDAKKMLPEWKEWRKALQTNTPLGYQAFLNKYPASRFRAEAEKLLGKQTTPSVPGKGTIETPGAPATPGSQEKKDE